MKIVTLKRLPNAMVEAELEVLKPELTRVADAVFAELNESTEVPGFRKGLAPRLMIIETVGLASFKQRVAARAIGESLMQLVKTKKLSPITEPAVTIHNFELDTHGRVGKPLTFSVRFELMPEVTIADYRKITLAAAQRAATKPKPVEGSDVETALARLRQRKADLTQVSRPVATGDWVELTFEAKVDGVTQEALSSTNYPLIVGSGVLIKGFEDHLIGMQPGNRKEFRLKVSNLPKPVDFVVTLNQHKAVKLPELNDQFAGLFGQPTLVALKEMLKRSLQNQRELLARHQQEDMVIKKLLQKTKTELPPSLVEKELNRLIGQLRDEMIAKGMNFEDYLRSRKETLADLRQKFLARAQYLVKTGLALAEVAKREKISTDDPQATSKVVAKLLKFALH